MVTLPMESLRKTLGNMSFTSRLMGTLWSGGLAAEILTGDFWKKDAVYGPSLTTKLKLSRDYRVYNFDAKALF